MAQETGKTTALQQAESEKTMAKSLRFSRRWLLVGAVVSGVVLFGFYHFGRRGQGPYEGSVYVREALDSSLVVPLVLGDTTAEVTPLARHLVLHLLMSDIRVQVDHVGRCGDIVDQYASSNERLASTVQDSLDLEFRTMRPVMLARRLMDECFSYTVEYAVPLQRPMRWGNNLLTEVPVRLALIHPLTDFQQFREE